MEGSRMTKRRKPDGAVQSGEARKGGADPAGSGTGSSRQRKAAGGVRPKRARGGAARDGGVSKADKSAAGKGGGDKGNALGTPLFREPISTTKRKPLTKIQRGKLWADHKGLCYLCGLHIEPTKPWTDEHVVPLGMGGSNDLANRRPVHMHCAEKKTREEDMPRIAKAKRAQGALVGKDPDAPTTFPSRPFAKKVKEPKTSPFAHLPLPRLMRTS